MAVLPDAPDERLVEAALRGDLDSFIALCQRHYPALIGIAQSVLDDRHLAEDAAQETLARACRSLPRLADPTRFASWLAAICRNAARDMLRRSPKFESLQGRETPAESNESAPETDAVRKAIMSLSDEAREVVYLRYYADRSYEEMSRLLGISTQAINGRLRRAREAIRQHLTRKVDIGGRP
jgi:RNA polymerase sigma-70 factor, ECF subfamily